MRILGLEGRFIERNGETITKRTHIIFHRDEAVSITFKHIAHVAANFDGVEHRPRVSAKTLKIAYAESEAEREFEDALRNPLQPFRPMPDGVHARHHGQQHLGRANTGLVAFSRRMCCSRVCRRADRQACRASSNADDAARHFSGVFLLRRHERRVRPAETHVGTPNCWPSRRRCRRCRTRQEA